MEYKMIFLDLDGTLVNSKHEIMPKTKEALLKAQSKGIKVVLASGRPTPGMVSLAQELELEKNDGYILSYNGGCIISCKTGEIVYNKIIEADEMQEIFKMAEKYNVDLLSYDKETVITNNDKNKFVQIEAEINKIPLIEVKNMQEYITYPVNKFIFLEEGDYLEKIEPEVAKDLPAFSVYRSAPFFLEIMPYGIDKANSMEILAKKLGISMTETIACGDGYNDLGLIKAAGLGVAMGNAIKEVLSIADYITESNNNEGIAHVVEKFIFKKC